MVGFKMSRPTVPPCSSESDPVYTYAHLLGIPFETRLEIYRYVLTTIHGERLVAWDQPQISSFDGLRLSCKQLYRETAETLFQYRAAKQSAPATLRLIANKTNFVQFRTLYLQLPLEYDRPLFTSLARFLQSFQLSIQELHLIFSGKDAYGNQVNHSSCGSMAFDIPEKTKPLSRAGQQIEKKLCLMRLLPNLRNLRLLRIHNLHCAMLKSSIMQNKPYLQALSITCDPRSAVADFRTLARSNPTILQGLIQPIQSPPPVEVLELDANTIVSVENAVNSLAPRLRHFGWRVPSTDLYPQDGHRPQQCFYSITARLMATLWRLPDLETLRLCISLPENDRKTWAGPGYASNVASGMSRYLSQCQNLKHLELHMAGAMPYVHTELMKCIPLSLQRLYLSHNTINLPTLVTSIRSRLFRKPCREIKRDSGVGLESAFLDGHFEDPIHTQEQQPLQRASSVCWISVNDRGHVEYTADGEDADSSSLVIIRKTTPSLSDFHDDIGMLGEFRHRTDQIPLDTGKLGFITCEYDYTEGRANDIKDHRSWTQYGDSDRTMIFRLNGQLLDREHNLHLACVDDNGERYGIRPAKQDQSETLEVQETPTTSKHNEILFGLQDPTWQPRCPFYIDRVLEELEVCFGKQDHWYFGHEKEAEGVFWAEPVAAHEGQKQKSILQEVEVVPSSRCQWMSPDADLPPVGKFPMPVLPNDWKEDV